MLKDHQAQYYQALEQADEQGDSTVFIQFMLSTIAKTLAQNAPLNAPANAPLKNAIADITGLKTPDAILVLLRDNPQLTRQELAEMIGKDIRTIGRAISRLQQDNQLKRIGPDKTGYWEVQAP